jgi:hydrogenase-4 component E
MNIVIIVLFGVTLMYVSVAERFDTYVKLVAIQGILLFFLAFSELSGSKDMASLVFVVTETLVFKAIAVPLLLRSIIKKMRVAKVHTKALPAFYSLLLVLFAMGVSVVLADMLKIGRIEKTFMIAALFTVFTGLILVIAHKKIFPHLVGFLVLENGVFMFSLAVGSEMPFLVNSGILLDLFASVLILGLFASRIGKRLNDPNVEELSTLKD